MRHEFSGEGSIRVVTRRNIGDDDQKVAEIRVVSEFGREEHQSINRL